MKALIISESRKTWKFYVEFFRTNIPSVEVICSTQSEAMEYAVQESALKMIIFEEENYSYSPPQFSCDLTDALGETSFLSIMAADELADAKKAPQLNELSDFHLLEEGSNVEVLKATIKKIFSNRKSKDPEADDGKLMPTSLKSFYYIDKVSYDVSFEVYSGKFMKVIAANSNITPSTIQKLAQKRVKTLYISKSAKLKLMKENSDKLVRQMSHCQDNTKELCHCYISVASVIQETVRDFGAVDFLYELIDFFINSIQYEVNRSLELSEILAVAPFSVMDRPEQSILIAIINLKMASDLKWKTITSVQKLILASLLHDVYIESEELYKINDKNDPIYSSLMNRKKEEFDNHIPKASKLEEVFSNYPSFSFLINFHHVIPEKKYTTSLNSISCLFSLNRRFVTGVLNFGYSKVGIEHTLKELEVFNYGKFRDPLALLRSYFLRSK